VLSTEPEVRVDYIAAVDWATLEPVSQLVSGSLFAIAVYVGSTRLIDNFVAE
jgi:pantoate--beta-alanine ligase